MPIYEYECTKCGHQTEAWQKFSDRPLTKCEKCNGRMKKLISQSTFHLKGSGWYVTDYASNRSGAAQTKLDTSPEKNDSSAKSDTKAEAKSETNPDKKGAASKAKKAND